MSKNKLLYSIALFFDLLIAPYFLSLVIVDQFPPFCKPIFLESGYSVYLAISATCKTEVI